jgi:hypothetical protein
MRNVCNACVIWAAEVPATPAWSPRTPPQCLVFKLPLQLLQRQLCMGHTHSTGLCVLPTGLPTVGINDVDHSSAANCACKEAERRMGGTLLVIAGRSYARADCNGWKNAATTAAFKKLRLLGFAAMACCVREAEHTLFTAGRPSSAFEGGLNSPLLELLFSAYTLARISGLG